MVLGYSILVVIYQVIKDATAYRDFGTGCFWDSTSSARTCGVYSVLRQWKISGNHRESEATKLLFRKSLINGLRPNHEGPQSKHTGGRNF